MFDKIAERIREWDVNGFSKPLFMEIWPTSSCNLACLFCRGSFESIKKEKEFELNKTLKLVREAISFGVQKFFISGGEGGEPFMRKKFTLSLMKLIKKRCRKGFVITNGTLIDKKTAKKIVVMKWDEIVLSIDGHNSKIHNYLRGKSGVFDKSISAARFLTSWKETLKSTSPRLIVQMVLTKKNYMNLEKMIELCNFIGCDEFWIQPLMVVNLQSTEFKLEKNQIKELKMIIQRAKKIANKYGIQTNIENFAKNKFIENSNEIYKILLEDSEEGKFLDIPCYEPWYRLTLTSEGKIGPCASLAKKMGIGTNSIKKAWISKPFQNIRSQIFNKNLSETCKTCCMGKVFDNREIRRILKMQVKR